MSLFSIHVRLITAWFACVTVVAAFALLAGAASFSVETALVWLAIGCVPPAILVGIWRGAPPKTVSQVIYDTEHSRELLAERLERIGREKGLDDSHR
jgi:hypothetical protein